MSDADATPTSIAPAGCNIPGEDQPMVNEFKEFIAKGNVMDLAVGVIIGAAFQKIVDSLVTDVVMPVVGLLLGGTDFSNMFVLLREGAKAPAPYASLAE